MQKYSVKNVRDTCIALTKGKRDIQIDRVLIERQCISNVSLGNVDVKCYRDGKLFVTGRFNTIVRSLLDVLNARY